MGLNIGEASDINTLLHYVLGEHGPYEDDVSSLQLHEHVGQAAARLADRAHKQLSAGLTGERILKQWQQVELGPWRDEQVTKPARSSPQRILTRMLDR